MYSSIAFEGQMRINRDSSSRLRRARANAMANPWLQATALSQIPLDARAVQPLRRLSPGSARGLSVITAASDQEKLRRGSAA